MLGSTVKKVLAASTEVDPVCTVSRHISAKLTRLDPNREAA